MNFQGALRSLEPLSAFLFCNNDFAAVTSRYDMIARGPFVGCAALDPASCGPKVMAASQGLHNHDAYTSEYQISALSQGATLEI